MSKLALQKSGTSRGASEMTISVRRTILAYGGSLLMVLPRFWIDSKGLRPRDEVEIRIFIDRLEIRPVKRARRRR